MSLPSDFIPQEEILLRKIKYAIVGNLGSSVVDSAELRQMQDLMMDRMAYRLQVELLSNELGRIVFTFPATPWDHWKRDWLPRLGRLGRWYLRRHPIRESASVTSASATFPKAHVAYPKELGEIRFLLQTEPNYRLER
ncbi:MAG TPA: hypothetical protein VMF31_10670 [Solirubrobacterales bacterium]|nr:hypothetical protein [Solirubrobacterales bacterium]